jgi:hypothetical protein
MPDAGRPLPIETPKLSCGVAARELVRARSTSHGGTFCQESVVGCPGDLEIAGPAVVLAFP